MKISLKNINYYYLTCNNSIRKEHILQEFMDYNLIEINPILGISKEKSGSTGFIRIIEKAIKNFKNNSFEPFVIFEDDVKKYREFPEFLEIPDNSDILYIGLSQWGSINGIGHQYSIYFDDIDANIIKIYNMLSMHGMIICSLEGLFALHKCMMESSIKNNRAWDLYIAEIQPYYNVYALKTPLVYQYGLIGGQEPHSKINHTNLNCVMYKKFDINNINTTNDSIITLL